MDALDEPAVDEHADAVSAKAGAIDISFNVINHGDVQGTPLAEMALADFEQPVVNGVRTMFLTGRAATLEDVGNVAAFAASDHARTITATSINITCGTEVG